MPADPPGSEGNVAPHAFGRYREGRSKNGLHLYSILMRTLSALQCSVVISLALAIDLKAAPQMSLGGILEQARKARWSDQASAIEVAGTGKHRGVTKQFLFNIHPEGRLNLTWLNHNDSTTTGYDRKEVWRYEQKLGRSYPLDLWMGDAELAWLAVWAGTWLHAGFPFEISLAKQ